MRLQLDSAVTGSGVDRSNETAAASAAHSDYDSRRLGGGSAGADSIRISSASSALAGLAADRAARVQQLAAQLKAGTYNVPASDIGRAMVAHAAAGAGMNK